MIIPWHKIRVNIVSGGKSQWPRGTTDQLPWGRITPDHDLWFVYAGHGWMELSTGRAELKPGVCLWLRPGITYPAWQDPKNPVGNYYVHFDLINEDGSVRNYNESLPPEILQVEDRRYIQTLFRKIAELVPMPGIEKNNELRQLRANETLRLLAIELDLSQKLADTLVMTGIGADLRRMMAALAEEISKKPWEVKSISSLAARSGYSTDHFARLFKAQTGHNPRTYLVRSRIAHAARLLMSTTLKIRDIARQVGYEEVYLFNRQFKEVYRYTPSEYRKLGERVANERSEQRKPFPRRWK